MLRVLCLGMLVGVMGCGQVGGSPGNPGKAAVPNPVFQGVKLSQWIDQLADRDPGRQVEASDTIENIGEEALPALVARLQSPDAQLRVRCLYLIGQLGKNQKAKLTPSVQPLTRDSNRQVKLMADGVLSHWSKGTVLKYENN